MYSGSRFSVWIILSDKYGPSTHYTIIKHSALCTFRLAASRLAIADWSGIVLVAEGCDGSLIRGSMTKGASDSNFFNNRNLFSSTSCPQLGFCHTKIIHSLLKVCASPYGPSLRFAFAFYKVFQAHFNTWDNFSLPAARVALDSTYTQ